MGHSRQSCSAADKIGSSDDSVYFYNQASQMEAFGSSECSATYEYDATGQRYESVVTSGAVTTTTTFSYEGLTLLSLSASQTDGDAWSLAYLYTGDGRPYAAVYSTETTTVPFSLLTTDRGDVVALLDSTGATFASYRYDQWGRPLATQTVATARVGDLAIEIAERQVLRYAGYAWDAESSLYYCSARYYDPATMQFLTKDIAKADAEESPYQYCSGDPVGKVDPSGMRALSKTQRRTFTIWAWEPLFGLPSGSWGELALSALLSAGEALRCTLTVTWYLDLPTNSTHLLWSLSWRKTGTAGRYLPFPTVDLGTSYNLIVQTAYRPSSSRERWRGANSSVVVERDTWAQYDRGVDPRGGSTWGRMGPFPGWTNAVRVTVKQSGGTRMKTYAGTFLNPWNRTRRMLLR